MAVLSLTWKSPYVDKTVFILRRGPGVGFQRKADVLYEDFNGRQFEYFVLDVIWN